MALYSLNHSSIGRTTHAAGTGGAHISYITRSGACREVIGQNMPIPKVGTKGGKARAWLDEQEEADRKNARVIDKVMIALPIELDEAQRVEAVRTFMDELTDGAQVPWVAAVHDKERDADNPHAHIAIRDRDVTTGKRALNLSEKGSTERIRETWERVCNEALERAGHAARIDRRSLQAQGIERAPQKHLGPIAAEIVVKGKKSWKADAIAETLAPLDPDGPVSDFSRFADYLTDLAEKLRDDETFHTLENLAALRGERAKLPNYRSEAKASDEKEWHRLLSCDVRNNLRFIDGTIEFLEDRLSIEPEATPEPPPSPVQPPQAPETPVEALEPPLEAAPPRESAPEPPQVQVPQEKAGRDAANQELEKLFPFRAAVQDVMERFRDIAKFFKARSAEIGGGSINFSIPSTLRDAHEASYKKAVSLWPFAGSAESKSDVQRARTESVARLSKVTLKNWEETPAAGIEVLDACIDMVDPEGATERRIDRERRSPNPKTPSPSRRRDNDDDHSPGR